jgi:hypothetical protein
MTRQDKKTVVANKARSSDPTAVFDELEAMRNVGSLVN